MESDGQEIKLHRALRLAHTSHRRFQTLAMTIRCWEDVERIVAAQGMEVREAERQEPREASIRVWIDAEPRRPRSRAVWPPPRYRVEDGSTNAVIVCDRPRWWVVDRNLGTLRSSWEDAEPGVKGPDEVADPWFHFSNVSWLKRWSGVAVRGTTEVAGRAAVLVAAREAMFDIAPGSDRNHFALDLERGVLLRGECFLDEVPLAVEEVVEITFDEPLPPGLFDEPELQTASVNGCGPGAE